MVLTRHPATTGIRNIQVPPPPTICHTTKAMVPQMMEMIPEFLVALGTARPRPYAAKGPAQRMPKAKVFMATIDTPNREISMATTADSTLQARV